MLRPATRPFEPVPEAVRRAFVQNAAPDDQTLCDLRAYLGQVARETRESQTYAHYAGVCDAALAILDPLLRQGDLPREGALQAVRHLVTFLDGGTDQSAGAGAAKPQATSQTQHLTASQIRPHPAADAELEENIARLLEAVREGRRKGQPRHSLKLVNHRRLGEILMSLTIISSDDLRTALLMQRMSGHRVGEVLIEMGLVRRDQLDQALTVQQDDLMKTVDEAEAQAAADAQNTGAQDTENP